MVEENGSLISTTGNTKWAAEQKVVNGKMEKTKSVVDFTKAVRSRIMDYFIVDILAAWPHPPWRGRKPQKFKFFDE